MQEVRPADLEGVAGPTSNRYLAMCREMSVCQCRTTEASADQEKVMVSLDDESVSSIRANRVVIVGGVAGGMSAATRLRRLDAEVTITVLERSGHVGRFANCGLPYFVGGIIEEEATSRSRPRTALRPLSTRL